MAFYGEPQQWYFHDLWKRTPNTWGGGAAFTWTRVDARMHRDYPEMARAETRSDAIKLSSSGAQGVARRFRWLGGSSWALEESRDTSDTGALGAPMVNVPGLGMPVGPLGRATPIEPPGYWGGTQGDPAHEKAVAERAELGDTLSALAPPAIALAILWAVTK